MNRRDFLKALGLTSAGLALNATSIATVLGQAPSSSFAPANRDPINHILNRITYGATPDLYDHVKSIGINAFIEEQLNPDAIDDSDIDNRVAEYDTTYLSTAEIVEQYQGMGLGPILLQLVSVKILRSRYANRQLFERMADFWSDHFHIYVGKNPSGFFKPVDERMVIRAHALDTFPNMLRTSAHSPAMLVYLDNAQSEKSHPNENYARELLELHTLGVDGGYTEDDVKAVARAFTGWSINRPRGSVIQRGEPGEFIFRPAMHDQTEKMLLGHNLPAGNGKADGDAILDLLAEHPATARFISTKLARRFISDFPPDSIVDTLTQTYLQTDGDIKRMMRTLLNSEEFWVAPPKFKRPFEYTMSLLRAVDYQEKAQRGFRRLMRDALEAMGQMPYLWPAPNGYPDVGNYWMNNLLPRWNMTVATMTESRAGEPNLSRLEEIVRDAGVSGDDNATIQYVAHYLLGHDLSNEALEIVSSFIGNYPTEQQAQAGVALLMASPSFQFK